VKPELAGVNVASLSNMSADAKKTDVGMLYGKVTGVCVLEMVPFDSTLKHTHTLGVIQLNGDFKKGERLVLVSAEE